MAQRYDVALQRSSTYWHNKPVMGLGDKSFNVKPICDNDVMHTLYNSNTTLPDGYTWNKTELKDTTAICEFLNIHYKQYQNGFMYSFTVDRLKWEMYDGYFLSICDPNNNIIGVVGIVNRTIQIIDYTYKIVEPVYMCCMEEYKKTGIAEVLMDEVARLTINNNIMYGAFVNNRIVSKPITTIRQYKRPLNYKKLRENNFIEELDRDENLVHTKLKIFLKPNKTYVHAYSEEHINIVYDLYNQYINTFHIHIKLSLDEIKNYMFNTNFTKTYIVYNNETPVDFITYNFYDIINTNNIIKAANILMYSSNSVTVELLFINILKQLSFDKIDIVYVNDIMHNNEAILSNVINNNEDSDEENAVYDMNMIKTNFFSMRSLEWM